MPELFVYLPITMNKILITFLTISLSFGAFAQNTCGTDQFDAEMQRTDPDYAERKSQYLKQLTAVSDNPPRELGKKAVQTIPVVFHVVHNYGEENVSREQIENALEILNADFRRQNADRTKTRAQFLSRAADCEVEFKLATKDPNGNCTDGITRHVSEYTDGGDEAVKSVARAWDFRKYMNVWVVRRVDRGAEGNERVLAYATLPYNSNSASDGIVISYDFLGNYGPSQNNYVGRTLTHETGHWLGLLHPFQDGCGSNCNSSGDYICDTPPVLKASYGCTQTTNSCSNDRPDELDMIENYMDYANGVCQNAFTQGQKDVMKSVLNNQSQRGQNALQSTHTATGIFLTADCAPKADFHVIERNTVVCPGTEIEFEDLSWNGDVTDRTWTFEGGTPSVSTFANPKVSYKQPGQYKVTLQVSNSKGSNSVTKTAFITVLDEVSSTHAPFVEDVETVSANEWEMGTEGIYGWKLEKTKSFSGSNCFRANITNSTAENIRFSLISPQYDISPLEGQVPQLSFRVAYSLREANSGELLTVYASSDCGRNWRLLRGYLGSTTLASVSGQNPNWTPSSLSDWKTLSTDLNRYGFDTSRNLMFRFDVTSRAGNSVFIDDINVSQFILGVPSVPDLVSNLKIAPNPSTGIVDIEFEKLDPSISFIRITDLPGRVIREIKLNRNSSNVYEQILFENNGMYLIHIGNESAVLTKKVIIAK